MAQTSIEWTDASWSPVVGCTRVSAGCDSCYAVSMTRRLEAMGVAKYAALVNPGKSHFNGVARLHEPSLDLPLRWKKARRVFVNPMSDLFHERLPDEVIHRVLSGDVTPRHTYQVLTKRAERMQQCLSRPNLRNAGRPATPCTLWGVHPPGISVRGGRLTRPGQKRGRNGYSLERQGIRFRGGKMDIPAILSAHAAWLRGDGDGVRANLTGADLIYADLTRADLTRADLIYADLTRADLTCADLTGADLTRANLTRANLTGANLTGANLTRANLTRANLTGADLTGADLARADLTGANLTGANLTYANLAGANLTRANLTGANLTYADLTGANLTYADLARANLARANLTGAKSRRWQLKGRVWFDD